MDLQQCAGQVDGSVSVSCWVRRVQRIVVPLHGVCLFSSRHRQAGLKSWQPCSPATRRPCLSWPKLCAGWILTLRGRRWVAAASAQLSRKCTSGHEPPFALQNSLQLLKETLRRWTPADLHRLVAHFLRVRFPMLLGLNKVGEVGANDCSHGRETLVFCSLFCQVDVNDKHVERLKQLFSHDVCIPMSAKAEWSLCQWRRKGG